MHRYKLGILERSIPAQAIKAVAEFHLCVEIDESPDVARWF
jgi:hypothetical protein